MKRNGFRNRFIALHPFVRLQIGSRFALFCLFMLTMNWIGAAIALFAPIFTPATQLLGFKAQFDKTGLAGDELKLIEKLETRMKDFPDAPNKADVVKEVRATMLKDFVDEDGKPTFDITKLKEMLGDDDKGIRSIVIKQGEKLAELAAAGGKKVEDLSIRGQVASFLEKNKDLITRMKNGENVSLPPLEIRAAATMTSAVFNPGGSAYFPRPGVEPGMIDLVERPRPTFWQLLQKGRTKLNPYIWINKKNKQGSAAFIGEGILKPLASFEISSEISTPKKVAERMKMSTELLYDVDGLTSFVEDELRFEVETKASTESLVGVESSTNPKGVTEYATAYTLVGIETTTPNNADSIRAAIAQLRLLNYTNIRAVINPVDAANMELAKGTDGHYTLPPFTTPNGQQVSGVSVIEDAAIPAGSLLIGDFSKYRVLMYQDFHIAWGWENDDFSKNLVTVIGEMRFHQFVSSNHAGAFIYDTFANIKTAIAA